jgi:allophanate hydrolase
LTTVSNCRLDLAYLQALYSSGKAGPLQVLQAIRERAEALDPASIWIHSPDWSAVLEKAHRLERAWVAADDPEKSFPLYGIPFAVKDNIDVAGYATTAACPDFAYMPGESATAVNRLEAAGAIFLGKTNLDQFATGLVGTRSPYGEVPNAFDPGYVSGGSSSGSAVAVAHGLASFALGTDTAGSGRVPAGYNNVVGLKPTRGLVSARGVVPACRSLDCVSIFALTCEDAYRILEVMRGPDAEDAFSRESPDDLLAESRVFDAARKPFRFGVPDAAHLEFFGNMEYRRLFDEAVARLESLGGTKVEVPFQDFLSAAALLYQGPWLAERWAAFGEFVEQHPGSVLPVIRRIVEPGRDLTAADGFRAQYRLQQLKRRCLESLSGVDFLAVPTAPTHYRRDEVAADPIGCNSRLGTYTNFVNLLDLCAVAVPSGLTRTGLPFGVTLIAPAFHEGRLSGFGAAFHAASGLPMGRSTHPVPEAGLQPAPEGLASLAVVGLHLSGQPLNGQLIEVGARLRGEFRTAPAYRLYALRRGERHFPGLIRHEESGAPIRVEVWDMSYPALGRFLRQVKSPLAIGTVELEQGRSVHGFLCEAHAIADAMDITRHGGWIAYQASRRD